MNIYEYKLKKYLHKYDIDKKDVYLNKISHIIVNMNCMHNTHNNLLGGGKINVNSVDSVLDYLKKITENVNNVTKNKYAVVLYGSPASGKRIGKHIACKYICDYFEFINNKDQCNSLTYKKIWESFVDTEVDSIIYNLAENDGDQPIMNQMKEKYQEVLKTALNKNTNDMNHDEIRKATKEKINDIVTSTSHIYFSKKAKADAISELIKSFSVAMNKNIFFEISSPNIEYIKLVYDSLKYYNYIPINIYPFIGDVNILYERAIDRGIKEGRFFLCSEGNYPLNKKITPLFENYPKVKAITDQGGYEKYLNLQYDSGLDKSDYDNFDKFNFENLEKYVLSYDISYIDANSNKISRSFIVDGYDERTKINNICKL